LKEVESIGSSELKGAQESRQGAFNRLLDIKETAALYNLKVSYLRGLVFRNQIPFYKIGALVRFDGQEVDQWMRSKRVPEGGAFSGRCDKPNPEFFEIDTRFNKASSKKEEV
jgi:excisionase family DNA binding protein